MGSGTSTKGGGHPSLGRMGRHDRSWYSSSSSIPVVVLRMWVCPQRCWCRARGYACELQTFNVWRRGSHACESATGSIFFIGALVVATPGLPPRLLIARAGP